MEGQTGDLLGTGPHGGPLLLPVGFDFVGVWELGAQGEAGDQGAGGKGYSSLCSTEIKFGATGFPAGLKTKVSEQRTRL